MTHDYKKLLLEFEMKGISTADAHRAVDIVKLEDSIAATLYAIECRDDKRWRAAFRTFCMIYTLMEREHITDLESLEFIDEQVNIEKTQRQQLSDNGNREKSILLASMLRYFCLFDAWQIALVMGVLESQSRASDDVMNMSFV